MSHRGARSGLDRWRRVVPLLVLIVASTSAIGQAPAPVHHEGAFRSGDALLAGDGAFAEIAERLAELGVAVLRYDDRGSGASQGDHAPASSADLARDVGAAVRYLQGRPRIDRLTTGLLGHSEGGMIAPMVAVRHPGVAFVISLAPPLAVAASVAQTGAQLELTAAGQRPALEALLYELVNAQPTALPPDQQARSGTSTSPRTRWWRRRWSRTAAGCAGSCSTTPPPTGRSCGYRPWRCSRRAVQVDLEQHRTSLIAAADPRHTKIARLDDVNQLFLRPDTGSVSEYGDLEPTLLPELFEAMAIWLDEVLPETFPSR